MYVCLGGPWGREKASAFQGDEDPYGDIAGYVGNFVAPGVIVRPPARYNLGELWSHRSHRCRIVAKPNLGGGDFLAPDVKKQSTFPDFFFQVCEYSIIFSFVLR